MVDFRGAEYIGEDSFLIKPNIILPASSGLSYLAIRYRNADCSHNWLTVSFDNIAKSGNSVGIDDLDTNIGKAKVYPNPTTEKFILTTRISTNNPETEPRGIVLLEY